MEHQITLTPEICKKADALYLKSSKIIARTVIRPGIHNYIIGFLLALLVLVLQHWFPDIVMSVFLYTLSAVLGLVLGMYLLLRMQPVPDVTIQNSFRFGDTGIHVENELCTSQYRWDAIEKIVRDDELVLLVLRLTKQYLVLDARSLSNELNELLQKKTA